MMKNKIFIFCILLILLVAPVSASDIPELKRLGFGDGGLPRYMGSYAISQSNSDINLVDYRFNLCSTVLTPYYQDVGGQVSNNTLSNITLRGPHWKSYYSHGSTATLNYTSQNRYVTQTCSLSNNSFDIHNLVNYSNTTLTVQDGYPVYINNTSCQFFGDGFATNYSTTVNVYTDNGTVECHLQKGIHGENLYSRFQLRNTSTVRENVFSISLNSPQLIPMQAPYGNLAVLALSEHADYTSRDSVKSVMYGTNNTSDPVYGTKGFIGHNLTGTWSVFSRTRLDGEGIVDSPEYKTVIDGVYNHGWEICPHNFLSTGSSTRALVAIDLPFFSKWYRTQNWIDHGLGTGNRNTGLHSEGSNISSSNYYVMDLCQQYGIAYTWSYIDYTAEPITLNRIPTIGLPCDIYWQNTNLNLSNGTALYQWSTGYYGPPNSLDLFSNSSIDNLITTYGFAGWHDYWANNLSTQNNYYYNRTTGNISPAFDSTLSYIENKKGDLWTPTMKDYIDYCNSVKKVSITCTDLKEYTLTNYGSTINGYAIRVSGYYSPTLDGHVLSSKTNRGDTIFWMDLTSGTHHLTLGAV